MKNKYIQPGKRFMDIAYLRDGDIIHTGESLVLALLLHAKGKSRRGQDEMSHLSKMMNDPNTRR